MNLGRRSLSQERDRHVNTLYVYSSSRPEDCIHCKSSRGPYLRCVDAILAVRRHLKPKLCSCTPIRVTALAAGSMSASITVAHPISSRSISNNSTWPYPLGSGHSTQLVYQRRVEGRVQQLEIVMSKPGHLKIISERQKHYLEKSRKTARKCWAKANHQISTISKAMQP